MHVKANFVGDEPIPDIVEHDHDFQSRQMISLALLETCNVCGLRCLGGPEVKQAGSGDEPEPE